MGNLLRLLARDDGTCCSPQKYDVYLDFESKLKVQLIFFSRFEIVCTLINFIENSSFALDASPTDNELPVYEEVEEVLNRSADILKELEEYRGAGEEIREVC